MVPSAMAMHRVTSDLEFKNFFPTECTLGVEHIPVISLP